MENSEQVLIYAPTGTEAKVTGSVLAKAHMQSEICASFNGLVNALKEGAGLAIIAIEAIRHADLRPLSEWIALQPSWSDFPFVVLSQRTLEPEQQIVLEELKAVAGNIIILDRPYHPSSLNNIVVNSLRGRRRQYKSREYLRHLSEGEARLRFLDSLGRETADSADADQILAVTTRMLGQYLNVSICAYADMEPDQDHFTIRGDWSKEGSPSIIGYYSLSDFGKLAVKNLSAGQPLIVNDNLAELAPEEAATFQNIGIAATICMPLIKLGRLTALMAIHDRIPRIWNPSELAILTEVTERSWAHIERVRSEAAARQIEHRFMAELEAKVTERTAAYEQSEKNIRAILETSHLYQGLLSIDGTVLYANATSLGGIQSAREDVVGNPFWETPWFNATPDMPELVRNSVTRVAAGETVRADMTLNLPTGIRRFDFAMRPVTNDSGEVVAMVPEGVETTERVRVAQALQQAQKMDAIGNLTGGVAHDFNNLLMAIQGSLELLRKRLPHDPTLMKLIDNALEGTKRGSSLTRRMLAFARRQDLKTEHINISALIDGMTELLQRSLSPMISIETNFPAELPTVYGDSHQLEAALLNLVLNARDAMNGEGIIRISARGEIVKNSHPQLGQGKYLCISVADNGEGMDEVTLKRSTEPFYTTKGIGKGTGLGLSMVHGLAAQSGGALVLHSIVGSGTTAEIWLPINANSENPRKPELPIPTASNKPQSSDLPKRLTIMAVDDDALVLMNTVAMLEDLGHDVSSAYSGIDALHLIRSGKFDLVITDHAMPKMTGAQLAATLRTELPDLPIILATGYAELPSGADPMLPRLSKPFSLSDLAEMVQRVFASNR